MESNILEFKKKKVEEFPILCECGCPVFHCVLRGNHTIVICVICDNEIAEMKEEE